MLWSYETHIRENIFQLPSLTWLCLAEIAAFGCFPSIPHLLSIFEDRFKSFPEGVNDLSRNHYVKSIISTTMNLLYNVCLAIIVLSEESISTLGTFYDFSESTNKVSGFLNSSRLNIYTLRITNLYLYYQ